LLRRMETVLAYKESNSMTKLSQMNSIVIDPLFFIFSNIEGHCL